MVPHHGTNWAALRLTAQIGRDAVLSESYGRGYRYTSQRAMGTRSRRPAQPSPMPLPVNQSQLSTDGNA